MRKCRTALPLPRYVVRRWSKRSGAWIHYWNLPAWANKDGCPVANETLGANYEEAVRRAETILLPAFDAWRGGDAPEAEGPAKAGTLDWLFAQYPTASSRSFPLGRGATRKGIFASLAATC